MDTTPSQADALVELLDTHVPIVVLQTHEEKQVLALAEAVARRTQRALWTWSASRGLRALRWVDGDGRPTEAYPFNPNGSPGGLTGVTTPDGRFTALMPHPERVYRNALMSWSAGDPSAASPWMRMFRNARAWVG